MKIYLTKDNVLKILCDHFHVPYVEVDSGNKVIPREDELYWEGFPKPVNEEEGKD